jgi:hypothetical protein
MQRKQRLRRQPQRIRNRQPNPAITNIQRKRPSMLHNRSVRRKPNRSVETGINWTATL